MQIHYDHKHFPNNICNSCTNILINTSSFIEMVQEANEKLNGLLHKVYVNYLEALLPVPDHNEEVVLNIEKNGLSENVSHLKQAVDQKL